MSSARRPTDPFQIVSLIALPADVLAPLEASEFGPFGVYVCADRDAVLARMAGGGCDALILVDDGRVDSKRLLIDAAHEIAMLMVATAPAPQTVLDWLQHGAQDVLQVAELTAAVLGLRLRAAIERKKLERDARTAYATDVETGLPHQQQLIEHMSQLIALREREPAPMALLALRIEGLATTEARLGREAANVLRRKVGVRLRSGVRASDVVASLADDNFAVLLGSMLTPADAARVGAKLLKTLMEPFKIAGTDVAVSTAIGIGQYPQDGSQPDALLRRALGLAATTQTQGRAGFSNFGEAGGSGQGAANDD